MFVFLYENKFFREGNFDLSHRSMRGSKTMSGMRTLVSAQATSVVKELMVLAQEEMYACWKFPQLLSSRIDSFSLVCACVCIVAQTCNG